MVFYSSLIPEAVQQYTVPEGSELWHLASGTFRVPAGTACTLPLLPSPCALLLFRPTGGALLYGGAPTLRHLAVDENGAYGVQLRSGCGDWLWSGAMTELTGRCVPLEPLLPGSDRLGAALQRCTSLTEQNALFARLAMVHGGRNYQSAPLLRRTLALIEQQHGQIRVAELAQSVGCSERHLNRLMHQKTGLATKTVCQLQQLHASLHSMLSAHQRSLLHLAVNCGYFDLAHMNRQYRQFLGCSAGEVLRRGVLPPDEGTTE